jgi:putative hydrolase of the HAD superfamily
MSSAPNGLLAIDAVIFDVGGVLSTSPAPLMVRRAVAAGIELATFAALALGPLDSDGDHPYHRAERGEISYDDMNTEITALAAAAGIHNMPPAPTGEELASFLEPVSVMIDFAREVRSNGTKVGILTNNIAEWGRWREKFQAHELADVIVDSAAAGVRKPHPNSYRMVLERLGDVSPSRALFLDDFVWNVEGARRVGLHAIHVTDHAVAISEARSLLGLTSTGTLRKTLRVRSVPPLTTRSSGTLRKTLRVRSVPPLTTRSSGTLRNLNER